MNSSNTVFIPGNIPSLKNSKQISQFRGKTILMPSKTVKKYLSSIGIQAFSSSKKTVDLYKTKPLRFPVDELKDLFSTGASQIKVGFHFIRGTKHRADFHNLVQIIADLMVAFDIIEDDDMSCFLPFPLQVEGEYFSYSKENPGVIVKILD